MNLAPLVFLGFIIFFMVMSARARKQAEQARRDQQRQQQERNETQSVEKKMTSSNMQKSDAMKYSATQPKHLSEPQQQKMRIKAGVSPTVTGAASQSTDQTRNTGASVKQGAVSKEEKKNSLIQWNQNSAMQGIILAEILGKPKALRK